MDNITKTLLGGAAICALATAPAMAGAPHFSITALHAGNQVLKSVIHNPGRQHVTYNFYVTTAVPGTVGTGTKLAQTYYKWNSNGSICSTPKMKLTGQKKSTYGKIAHNTESYSEGCGAPTIFYGDEYTLTKASGDGKTDSFTSDLIGKYANGSAKYLGKLNIHATVEIGN